MKISISEAVVYSIDEIDVKKTALKLYGYDEEALLKEYEDCAKPIVLENFRMWRDDRGILCLRFDTKNHKYLEINSSCYILDRVIELHTGFTVNVKGMEFDCPVSSLEIRLSPESKYEEDFVRPWTKLTVTPLKWEYELMLVPTADFNEEAEVFQLQPEQPKSIKL